MGTQGRVPAPPAKSGRLLGKRDAELGTEGVSQVRKGGKGIPGRGNGLCKDWEVRESTEPWALWQKIRQQGRGRIEKEDEFGVTPEGQAGTRSQRA